MHNREHQRQANGQRFSTKSTMYGRRVAATQSVISNQVTIAWHFQIRFLPSEDALQWPGQVLAQRAWCEVSCRIRNHADLRVLP